VKGLLVKADANTRGRHSTDSGVDRHGAKKCKIVAEGKIAV